MSPSTRSRQFTTACTSRFVALATAYLLTHGAQALALESRSDLIVRSPTGIG